MTPPKAVVLLSGGMDSATTAAIARRDGFDVYALSFRYGQRHAVELDAGAAGRGQHLGVRDHVVIDIDLRAFGGSALTADIDGPEGPPTRRDRRPASRSPTCPRATRSSSRSRSAWAEVLGAADIFIGVNALDYSGYPDCRPEYIEAFERMANLATRAGVEGRAADRSTRR